MMTGKQTNGLGSEGTNMKFLSTFLVVTVIFAFSQMKAPTNVSNIKSAIEHTPLLKR